MANNDVLNRDSNNPAFTYTPETMDLGGVVRRPLIGASDGAVQTLGSMADVAATSDTANASLMSLLRRGLGNWTSLLSRIPTKGAANTAGSWAISLATDQAALPVTLSGNVSIGNFPTSQNVVVTSLSGTINVGNIPSTQNVYITGSLSSINVGNFPSSYSITNFPASQNVVVTSLSGTINVGNFPLTSNIGNFPSSFNVGNFPATQNVSLSSVPLASGAANSTNQATEISLLNFLANNSPTLGQKNMAGSLPVTIANNQLVSVNTPIPANIVTGQIKIAVTGTAVNLPSAVLLNGIGIKAKTTNANNGFLGSSNVTTAYDGTGNGFALEPGATASFNIPNANSVWVNGTAGDIFTYQGN